MGYKLIPLNVENTKVPLNDEGLHGDDPGSILTYTGRAVNPLTMAPGEIHIADIAHSLALQCRYNGHSSGFYSVARHSILVAERLKGTEHELAGLLHDAAEAYLGDLVRPLKHTTFGAVYRIAEGVLNEKICSYFGLPDRALTVSAVKDADDAVLCEIEAGLTGLRFMHDGRWRTDEQDFLDYFEQLTKVQPAPVIVGISGYARSGKDTMGRILAEDYGFEVVKFAGLLYDILYAMNPITRWTHPSGERDYWGVKPIVDMYGWEYAKAHTDDVRGLLQRLGTEGVRNHLGEDTWVDAAMRLCKPGGKYVFTDVRFPNEADAILDAGGSIWRMQRVGNVPESEHASEQLVDSLPYDYRINAPEIRDTAALRGYLVTCITELVGLV